MPLRLPRPKPGLSRGGKLLRTCFFALYKPPEAPRKHPLQAHRTARRCRKRQSDTEPVPRSTGSPPATKPVRRGWGTTYDIGIFWGARHRRTGGPQQYGIVRGIPGSQADPTHPSVEEQIPDRSNRIQAIKGSLPGTQLVSCGYVDPHPRVRHRLILPQLQSSYPITKLKSTRQTAREGDVSPLESNGIQSLAMVEGDRCREDEGLERTP